MSSNRPTEIVASFTEHDFIANLLYQADAKVKGFATGARWWCLRDDLRQTWRAKARSQFLEWAQDEQQTMERNRGMFP